jgi:hypothetical protein
MAAIGQHTAHPETLLHAPAKYRKQSRLSTRSGQLIHEFLKKSGHGVCILRESLTLPTSGQPLDANKHQNPKFYNGELPINMLFYLCVQFSGLMFKAEYRPRNMASPISCSRPLLTAAVLVNLAPRLAVLMK